MVRQVPKKYRKLKKFVLNLLTLYIKNLKFTDGTPVLETQSPVCGRINGTENFNTYVCPIHYYRRFRIHSHILLNRLLMNL